MTNPEERPDEVTCTGKDASSVEIMTPREVPLGGLRAMRVRRTLPQRQRSLIGAWCFVDHYGPDPVAETGGMNVAPHPHTGLQTVSWLFTGEVEHRDSAGHHATVRPGEVNLMTAGRGISHSEVSTPDTATLHGAQLWVALPDDVRDADPGFEHYAPAELTGDGWRARVFLGSLLGDASPVTTHTPLLGAELLLDTGATLELDVDPTFEHGVLVDSGVVTVGVPGLEREKSGTQRSRTRDSTVRNPGLNEGTEAKAGELAYVPMDRGRLELVAGSEPARLLLLGGPPFGEAIVMWWNFVGRSHEEIVGYREEWQAQIEDPDPDSGSGGGPVLRDGRFGIPVDDPLPPIPAPPLPNARLRKRG